MDIGAWLRGLGLQQYEQAFCNNAIDAAILPELTADDLKDLGVRLVGHRCKGAPAELHDRQALRRFRRSHAVGGPLTEACSAAGLP